MPQKPTSNSNLLAHTIPYLNRLPGIIMEVDGATGFVEENGRHCGSGLHASMSVTSLVGRYPRRYDPAMR